MVEGQFRRPDGTTEKVAVKTMKSEFQISERHFLIISGLQNQLRLTFFSFSSGQLLSEGD